MKRLIIAALALLSCANALRAMNGDDFGNGSPGKDVLRRGNWNRSPRLRKRAVNNAQENNCGYIAVEVALHAPFSDGIAKIQKASELKGNTIDQMDHWLTLFTFNVPITNELLRVVHAKALRIKNNASQLTDEDRKVVADRIKEFTYTTVDCVRDGKCFSFDLDEVVAENGIAEAYFTPSEEFISSLKQMRALLEQHYRWGTNKQDGVWFDFEKADTVRPYMKILTPGASKRLKDAFTSGKNLLLHSGKKISLESSRHSIDLSRHSLDLSASGGDGSPVIMARQRRNDPNPVTPPRSPEVSPRASREGSPRKSFDRDFWKDNRIRTLDVSGNDLRVNAKIVETKSGNCE